MESLLSTSKVLWYMTNSNRRIFEHGGIRHVTETTLAAKIIANQINQHSSILSQNFKIKVARSKRSNENKASDIKTQNNPPLSSSDNDQQTQASLESQQHSKDELMSIIQRQDQKIQNLTNRLNNLEQLVYEWQSDALLAKRTNELLAREVDRLKQYPRRSCLVILCVKFPEDKNKETAAETTEKVKKLLTDSLHIDPTEFNNEIDRVHRLPLTNKQKQTEKTSTPNIICMFKTHSYREKRFSKRNKLHNNSNKKIKFHVSLTKHRSDLLEKAQNHIRNLQGIKFCFADPNGNLKAKFNDNKNMNFGSLKSLGNVIERKLGIGELSNRSIKKMY